MVNLASPSKSAENRRDVRQLLLESLGDWGDIAAHPDSADVATVEDFYRPRHRHPYKCRGYTHVPSSTQLDIVFAPCNSLRSTTFLIRVGLGLHPESDYGFTCSFRHSAMASSTIPIHFSFAGESFVCSLSNWSAFSPRPYISIACSYCCCSSLIPAIL